MAYTRGFKGEKTQLFPDQKPFNNRHKTQPLNPALEFNGCVLFLVIISYRLPINFITRMPSLNPPVYKQGSSSAIKNTDEMLSVLLDEDVHKKTTKELREEIGYRGDIFANDIRTNNATPQEIWKAIK